MYCPIESSLLIKANGEIPCGWCGLGMDKILYRTTEKTDFINAILFGDRYKKIRNSFKRNQVPWPLTCPLCFLIEKDKPFYSPLVEERAVPYVQIEPSYLCQLDCGACFPRKKNRKKVKSPPYDMPLELLKKVVIDLQRAGFTVTYFDFLGQGEPLMNRDIWKMTAFAKEHFPECFISLSTNGNFKYNKDANHAGLSQLIVSVDGCFQDSYEIYRRNGDINTVFRFIEQFANEKSRHNLDTKLIWKYLLFGHNDSDSELIEAQKKAVELGVDSISFQVTPLVGSYSRSRFYDKKESSIFPLIETDTRILKILTPEETHPHGDFLDSLKNNKLAMILWGLHAKLFKKDRY